MKGEPQNSSLAGLMYQEALNVQQPSSAFEPLLDDVQAAELLGIHPKTLQRMARNGEVPAYRVGRFWRYRASELNAWLHLRKAPCSSTGYPLKLLRQPARVD